MFHLAPKKNNQKKKQKKQKKGGEGGNAKAGPRELSRLGACNTGFHNCSFFVFFPGQLDWQATQ